MVTGTDQRLPRLGLHVATAALLVGLLAVIAGLSALTARPPDFTKLCADGQPYYVTAAYRAQTAANKAPNSAAASIILFQDTPDDRPQYVLATQGQTGAVWGLAYRSSEPAVYAAAYHKTGLPYGPGGGGAIYRIDLGSGDVAEFARVPNAGNGNPGAMPSGELTVLDGALRDVGKTALGGLELNADESELFVTNLNNRRIYRYAMPGGTLLGSFDHGAVSQPWAEAARPFGLTYHDGHLYHGVVNSDGAGPDFVAQVYRSRPDGTDMVEVASLNLEYDRDDIRLRTVPGRDLTWQKWSDNVYQAMVEVPTPRIGIGYPTPQPKPRYEPKLHRPQPMFTDLAVTAGGDLAIALRDRYCDMPIQWVSERHVASATALVIANTATFTPTPEPGVVIHMAEEALGFGDILRGKPDGNGRWRIQTTPEHFDDANDLRHTESAFGGVAWVPSAAKLASTHFGIHRSNSESIVGEEGVYWYDVASGNKVGLEGVGKPGGLLPYSQLLQSTPLVWADNEIIVIIDRTVLLLRDVGSLGDIEALCAIPPDAPTLPPPTVIAPSPTTTTSPSPTPTEPPPSPRPTDTPVRATDTAPPPTLTPTPTEAGIPPTPTRPAVYLPILLREHCDPTRVRADVVLVLDASSSMTGDKLAAAKAAAVAFIRAMRLPEDQVGVVAFNATATVVSPLSRDGAALEAAIDAIGVAVGTRIDAGLEAARGVLAGPERAEGHVPVVVVLTDGIQSADPERPLAIADALRAAGVDVYVVGLGSDVDASYLARMVSGGRLFLSPTPAQLAGIYERIARLIPCPPEVFWGGR